MKTKSGEYSTFPRKGRLPMLTGGNCYALCGKDTLSEKAQLKLEWIIFYQTVGKRNASLTAAHFGINPKHYTNG